MGSMLMPLLAGLPTTLVAVLAFVLLAVVPVVVIVVFMALLRFAARRVGYPGAPPPPARRAVRLRGPHCWSVDSRP